MIAAPRPSVIVFNDTRVDRHHGCTLVLNALDTLLGDVGFSVSMFVPAHHDWRGDAAVHHAIDRADLLVVNGEGSLHHDRPAVRILLEAGVRAQSRGIPAVLVNALWQENATVAVEALRNFALVAVRDTRSAKTLQASGIDCRVVPDLSLYTPVKDPASVRAGIGVSDSVDRRVAVSLEAIRRDLDARAISIHERRRGGVDHLAFIRSGIAAMDFTSPRTMMALLKMRRTQAAAARHSPGQLLNDLASIELLVTGRYHLCTMAMVTGTPFIGVGTNTHKIDALVEDAGLESWRARDVPAASELRDPRVFDWTDAEKTAVSEYLNSAHESARALYRDIRALV